MFNPFEKPALIRIDGGTTHIVMAKLYSIEEAKNPADLEAKVNVRLAQGWQIVGGLVVEKGVFYQAMQK